MTLEDEARQMAAKIASESAAIDEWEAKERWKRSLEQTPRPPSWTGELIDLLDGYYFSDQDVYRVVASDEVRDGYRQLKSIRYELLGRGWGLCAYFWSDGRRASWSPTILLRDGNVYSGGWHGVRNDSATTHVGFPPGTKAVLVANSLLTTAAVLAADSFDPSAAKQDQWLYEIYGLGAAAAILSGSAKAVHSGLEWPDHSNWDRPHG
ncbi:hypothetical protein [Arthrobacter sp. UYCo732]|uniref:hypothetical protein n=1 Tax=Arthrobacter sp. UYCo732 TaxID=3156336 RepID=UPI0033932A45